MPLAHQTHTRAHRHHDVAVPTRFRDLNPAHHVDNLAVLRLCDEARLAFLYSSPVEVSGAVRGGLLEGHPESVSDVIAAITVDYRLEVFHDSTQAHRCSMWVSRIGSTSFDISSELFAPGSTEPAVATMVTVVLVDHSADGAPWAISPQVREALEAFRGDQVPLRVR